MSKLLEKIVHKHLYAMLESHDLLYDHQFGFRRKRSTTSLLMTTVHDWAAGLNLSQTTHCLFLDMSKAFDSVLHERLLLNRSLRYFMTYLIEIIVPRYSYILQGIQNFKSYFHPFKSSYSLYLSKPNCI